MFILLNKQCWLTVGLYLVFSLTPAFGQSDTLPELLVRDAYTAGAGRWQADSLPHFTALTAAERLLWESPVQLRTNGPGLLSTASLRGAGPSRTPVIWEDINLQSPMNGVYDLALLPIWPADHLEIHFGGQSAGLSSGAMSGSINLSAETPSVPGWHTLAALGGGSFGRADARMGLAYAGTKWQSNTRGSWVRAENNFPYRNTAMIGAPRIRQSHARQQVFDLQQFVDWRPNARNTLRLSAWGQGAQREISPSMTETTNDGLQTDQSLRAVLSWLHTADTLRQWRHRLALLDEYIDFYTLGQTERSHSRTLLASSTFTQQTNRQWLWKTGVVAQQQQAQAAGYADSTRWYRQWRLAAYTFTEKSVGPLRLSLALRQEWAQNQAAPFTAAMALHWQLPGNWSARLLGSRNFTLPTFNDRYWRSLGNSDLRPEKGYSADALLTYKTGRFKLEAGMYTLLLDDWILWQPGPDGLFRPGNLRKVWSRGCLTTGEVNGRVGRLHWRFKAHYQLSIATNTAVYDGFGAVLGKQLPYTPRHGASGNLSLRGKHWTVTYLQQWTGRRFTGSDNSAALPGFTTGAFLAGWAPFRRWQLEGRVENCWNTAYQVVAFRPMPGRSWHLGFGFKF